MKLALDCILIRNLSFLRRDYSNLMVAVCNKLVTSWFTKAHKLTYKYTMATS